MTQVLPPAGGYLPNERFCTFCDCAVDLHDEIGCACDDSKGHYETLESSDGDEFCACQRTREEFDQIGGWSRVYADPRNHAGDRKADWAD